jgi:hypothetical protein
MVFNFSMIDGVLIAALVIVVIWMALKLATRLVLGAIILVVIAVAFFGLNLPEIFADAG